nr:protein sip5 [Quercus suber]
MARSTSNLGNQPTTAPEEHMQGKGKQPAHDVAGNRSASPESPQSTSSAIAAPQRHLEESRAHLPNSSLAVIAPTRALHMRHLSNTSSAASSIAEPHMTSESVGSSDGTTQHARDEQQRPSTPPAGAPSEPMFNFRSLAAMIGDEEKERGGEHVEHVDDRSKIEDDVKEPSPTGSPRVGSVVGLEGNRSRGDSDESSSSIAPLPHVDRSTGVDEAITSIPVPPTSTVHDEKDLASAGVLGRAGAHEATQ